MFKGVNIRSKSARVMDRRVMKGRASMHCSFHTIINVLTILISCMQNALQHYPLNIGLLVPDEIASLSMRVQNMH